MLCQWLPNFQEDWSRCSRTSLSGLWDLCVPVLTLSPSTAMPGLPLTVPLFLILNPGFSWGLPGPSLVFSWSHLLEKPFLFFQNIIYLFIFGCAGSLFLYGLFSSGGVKGLLSSCSARGFSLWWLLLRRSTSSRVHGLQQLQHVGSVAVVPGL